MVEALIDVWRECLIDGERIELENFLVLEVKEIDRSANSGTLVHSIRQQAAPRIIRRVIVKSSKYLKSALVK
jgi:hypothetical protein